MKPSFPGAIAATRCRLTFQFCCNLSDIRRKRQKDLISSHGTPQTQPQNIVFAWREAKGTSYTSTISFQYNNYNRVMNSNI
jgi:hypothetical protein